jgi:hypothetical protein
VVLKKEFLINTNWNKEKVEELAKISGLYRGQVYKWNWDQRKRVLAKS